MENKRAVLLKSWSIILFCAVLIVTGEQFQILAIKKKNATVVAIINAFLCH